MTDEPKKISFGFSKVSKKNTIVQPKKEEVKSDIQFIACLEEKAIKLVSGEEEKKKELPIIPMQNGNLLRESIREVAKSRVRNEDNTGKASDLFPKEGNSEVQKESLTLDELAAKELLEDSKKSVGKKIEKGALTVPLGQIPLGEKQSSSLEDYENMPISDFGLAMLRGMGWDPKKGIGLNEKIVTPLAPKLRPKGMGLGADRVPNAKSVTSNGELLIMKKGALVKIISGPHDSSYGKIEGFDELPGRLMVRLSTNNTVVSLNEIMIQLVSLDEFNKNVKNTQTKPEIPHARSERYEHDESKRVRSEKTSKEGDNYGLIYSKHRKESRAEEKQMKENGKFEKKSMKKERDKRMYKRSSSSEESGEEESSRYSSRRKRSRIRRRRR